MKREINGLLVLDKPSGITSREALDQASRWFPRQTRIGHTGTLDPLATGVLVLCLGRATRLAEFVQGMDKSYRATFVFGARSDTDDADGTIVPVPDASTVDAACLRDLLATFVGAVEQTPRLIPPSK
jgi:tRNA pseudouridine55 synthase